MSNVPHYLPAMRTGQRLGHAEVVDGLIKDGEAHWQRDKCWLGGAGVLLILPLVLPHSAFLYLLVGAVN